jgi:hypothetical protein
MAREGLRTLVIARKKLGEDLLKEFEIKYAIAIFHVSYGDY